MTSKLDRLALRLKQIYEGFGRLRPLKLVLILIFILYAESEVDMKHVRTRDITVLFNVHFSHTVIKNGTYDLEKNASLLSLRNLYRYEKLHPWQHSYLNIPTDQQKYVVKIYFVFFFLRKIAEPFGSMSKIL